MKNKGLIFLILALIVVFVAGGVSGIFLDRHVISHRHQHERRGGPPSLEKLAKDLDLTAEQQEKIKDIFRRSEEKFKELRGDMHERLKAIREQIKNEIDTVLTPEQKQKLESMIQKQMEGRSRDSRDRPKEPRQSP